MQTIYVDADACPVKDEIYKVAQRYDWNVRVVSNMNISIPASPLIENVVVKTGFNSADDWIAEHAAAGDIVVTEDIPLAQRCLENDAQVIGTRGRVFTESAMGEAMASRELLAQLREVGLHSGGPSPFRDQDRSKFLQRLDQTIHEVKKQIRRIQNRAKHQTPPPNTTE